MVFPTAACFRHQCQVNLDSRLARCVELFPSLSRHINRGCALMVTGGRGHSLSITLHQIQVAQCSVSQQHEHILVQVL